MRIKKKRIELSVSDWELIAQSLTIYAHTEYNCSGVYCKREIDLANLIANKIEINPSAGRLEIP